MTLRQGQQRKKRERERGSEERRNEELEGGAMFSFLMKARKMRKTLAQPAKE